MLIDTHSHIYDEAFDADRDQAIGRAVASGVGLLLMPAIDSSSHEAMLATADSYPDVCVPMIGLHPTSVNDNPDFGQELEAVERYLAASPRGRFCAVGEVGMDLYWSRDFVSQQRQALTFQAELALRYGLPLVVHCRDAWSEMLSVLEPFAGRGLRGVMHAFSGGYDEYVAVRRIGDFMIGVGGQVTYKKNSFAALLPMVSAEHIVLETDSPYLTPVPHRGERNESCYIPLVCSKVAEIMGLVPEAVADITTANARRMFGV